MLCNYVSPNVFEYVAECTTYESATELLESLYVKPQNKIFARHQLRTCRQQPGQTLDEYLQRLKQLSKNCGFKPVSAEIYRKRMHS